MNIKLCDIACARSGDKGSNVNIGVIAYTARGYQFLKEILTAKKVDSYFSGLGQSKTDRYELDNLEALNFVLRDCLGGGGSRSLRIDSQGKVLGQALMEMEIDVAEDMYEQMRKKND